MTEHQINCPVPVGGPKCRCVPEKPTPPGPPVEFRKLATRSGRSAKVACTVCGRTGHDFEGLRVWKNTCRRGHLPCDKGCGKLLAVQQNGAARSHPRCPKRKEGS